MPRRVKDARNSQNPEETGRMPLTAWEGARPCWHLDFGLHPPKLWENTFLLFQAPQFVMTCYGSHRKSMYSKTNVSYQGFPVNAKMQGAGSNHRQTAQHSCGVSSWAEDGRGKVKKNLRSSLVVQWLRLQAPNAGGPKCNPQSGS